MTEVTLQHNRTGVEFVVTEAVAAELVAAGTASYTKPRIEVSEAEAETDSSEAAKPKAKAKTKE